jgi:transposase-like protein
VRSRQPRRGKLLLLRRRRPHHDALLKLLWLAQRDIAKSWTMSLKNWGEIIAALAILWLEKIRL